MLRPKTSRTERWDTVKPKVTSTDIDRQNRRDSSIQGLTLTLTLTKLRKHKSDFNEAKGDIDINRDEIDSQTINSGVDIDINIDETEKAQCPRNPGLHQAVASDAKLTLFTFPY